YVGVITAIAPAQSRPSRSSRGVYLRTADLFRGADFFRGTPFRVGGLRTSLTALPAWNRTALLAAISMVSPVRGFRASRAGRAAALKMPRPRHRPPRRPGGQREWRLPQPSPPGCRRLVQLSGLGDFLDYTERYRRAGFGFH